MSNPGYNPNVLQGSSNGPGSASFQQIFQTYQRLQSQESNKMDQLRMAQMGGFNPGQGGPQDFAPNNFNQAWSNQPQMAGQQAGFNFANNGMQQAGGVNVHSRQQGLNLQGAMERERLQKLVSSHECRKLRLTKTVFSTPSSPLCIPARRTPPSYPNRNPLNHCRCRRYSLNPCPIKHSNSLNKCLNKRRTVLR